MLARDTNGMHEPIRLIERRDLATFAASATVCEGEIMPMSFGIVGKAIALFMVVAFALWLIFTYVFTSDRDADYEAERIGAIEIVVNAVG